MSENRTQKKLLPPTYFAIFLLLTIALRFALPWPNLFSAPYNFLGILLLGVGVWLNLWADRLFKQRNTTVKPFEKSTALIQDGPFRFSRHPMYLGMVTILLGVSVLLSSLAALIAPIGFFYVMEKGFIPHEEKALEQTFGQQFLDYKRRVRRWL